MSDVAGSADTPEGGVSANLTVEQPPQTPVGLPNAEDLKGAVASILGISAEYVTDVTPVGYNVRVREPMGGGGGYTEYTRVIHLH